MAKKITLPLTEELAKTLHAGDQVLLSEAEQLERVVRLCLKEELL